MNRFYMNQYMHDHMIASVQLSSVICMTQLFCLKTLLLKDPTLFNYVTYSLNSLQPDYSPKQIIVIPITAVFSSFFYSKL